jgi:hypothetical protein
MRLAAPSQHPLTLIFFVVTRQAFKLKLFGTPNPTLLNVSARRVIPISIGLSIRGRASQPIVQVYEHIREEKEEESHREEDKDVGDMVHRRASNEKHLLFSSPHEEEA